MTTTAAGTRVTPPGSPGHGPRPGPVGPAVRRHWVFLTVLVAGVGLRVVTQLAYRPALLFVDSWNYLSNVTRLDPAQLQPAGYPAILLRPVLWVGGLAAIAGAQHLLGIAMGLAIYLVLVRNGVRPWLAGLAAAPVLLDAYQLQIEQNVMSDALFEALALAGILVLLWQRPPTRWMCLAGGVLLGAAVSVRSVGIVLSIPVVAFAVLATPRGTRLRRAVTVAAAFAVPVVAYAAYYSAVSGRVGIMATDAGALYGRAASIADCGTLSVPSYERTLCPSTPIAQRKGDQYASDPTLSARLRPPTGMTTAQVKRDFAVRVFRHQPVDLVEAVAGDFVQGFSWPRATTANEVPLSRWQFQLTYPTFPPRDPVPEIAEYGGGGPAVTPGLAQFLRDYQLSVGYVPGPLLAAGFAAGLLAAAGLGRARRSPLRPAAMLAALSGLSVLLAADFFEFSWRYQQPALVFAPLAGVLGLHALLGPRRTLLPVGLDDTDHACQAAFRRTYGAAPSAPVVVVIAAYQEAGSIGAVLDELPTECRGLGVDTLVVVDGATDATAQVAAAHGARVCIVPVNRGQGAALRLGYALARSGGAEFIVTTDADGQYVGAELPELLQPLIEDTADLVTGSRWLGHQQTTDRIRRLGSRVFAGLATFLTGQRVSDTSFGFRAMRADVTESVVLRQPQYQASELLMAAIANGFRVAERPMTMRPRTHGRTKKGNFLVYGSRYARVLVGTWLRDRHSRHIARDTATPVRRPGPSAPGRRTPTSPADAR